MKFLRVGLNPLNWIKNSSGIRVFHDAVYMNKNFVYDIGGSNIFLSLLCLSFERIFSAQFLIGIALVIQKKPTICLVSSCNM